MKLVNRFASGDGTFKYVFQVPVQRDLVMSLPEGSTRNVEAAFLDMGRRKDAKPRYVLCLSSMVGCNYCCNMCRNMFSSFYRCIGAEEIEEQIDGVLKQDGNLDKIKREGSVEHAFMGIGEPLFGYNVTRAMERHKPYVADTRFAVSTLGAVGYIPKLSRADIKLPVRLEISLHFSNDRLRQEWIQPKSLAEFRDKPELVIAKTLWEAEQFMQKHPGKVTLNYALIDGLNNSEKDVEQIDRLLGGRKGFYVKVMEANHTSGFTASWRDDSNPFGLDMKKRKPFHETPEAFRDALLKHGVEATVFRSKGKDVRAGCGMMVSD